MIAPDKLKELSPGQKRRKLALTFGELERDIAGIAEPGLSYNFPSLSRADYTKKVAQLVLLDEKLPQESAQQLKELLQAQNFDERRVCNYARNALLDILGTFPAEWDLVIAPHSSTPGTADSRSFFPGTAVYAEDIRSPFNLGSIFRTAEAMGLEKVFISPACTPPEQTKAQRSSMGCINTLGYSRYSLEEVAHSSSVFVLETGGTPLNEFDFPEEGTVIIGSEELGVSPEALKLAGTKVVSIPMTGLKASLNVGVAFGILVQAWTDCLRAKGIKPTNLSASNVQQ